MSSSGLIYAVIVGAWAAYLVPMWLRRQDELNEARPTERFSTAIRLLSGRAAMERRISRSLDDRNDESPAGEADGAPGLPADAPLGPPAGVAAGVPAGVSAGVASGVAAGVPEEAAPALAAAGAVRPRAAGRHPAPPAPARPTRAEREARAGAQRRARLLARRRRMVTLLFLAFTLGAVVAGVGGLAFLWAPLVPAVLLSLYIGRLRRQERLRYEVKLDRRRAAEAAQRLHERERQRRRQEAAPAAAAPRPRPRPQAPAPPGGGQPRRPARPHDAAHPAERPAASAPAAAEPPQTPPAADPTAERQALVEATDHEEWVDGLRERSADPDSWDPVPVPLPTYVTAPVAPRSTGSLDLNAPDAWSAGRTATPPPAAPQRGRTPLFDQYADPDDDAVDHPRPRAANE
ncbi:gephyrin-like molybdotransferase receptor GlpR [Streptomyces sp. NPDC092296]|uniref:divisome protein SepX/GlpR n=1 Tax=Streptomyces sp. NPDC092296 TaxID=3366012 RepID=UPI00382013BA